MTHEEDLPKWPSDVVADNFRSEIRARFEAHNVAYRAKEQADLEQVLLKHPERRGQPGFEVRDSGLWTFYQACEIKIERNTVTIVAPPGSLDMRLVHMFDNTTMAWSKPWVKAVIVDGEPRLTIEIVLVATWDDSLDMKWREDGENRRRLLVELFEDDVHRLIAMIDAWADSSAEEQKLREQLKLELEFL